MNKTCADCLCEKVCRYNDGHNLYCKEYCPIIKDKSRYIELPCAAGDVVYKTVCYKNLTATPPIPVKIVGFHLGKFPNLRGHKRKEYLIGYDSVLNSLQHLNIDEIGKTVFLTKEDAEKALKGGAE